MELGASKPNTLQETWFSPADVIGCNKGDTFPKHQIDWFLLLLHWSPIQPGRQPPEGHSPVPLSHIILSAQ